jgi:hypothetical protein
VANFGRDKYRVSGDVRRGLHRIHRAAGLPTERIGWTGCDIACKVAAGKRGTPWHNSGEARYTSFPLANTPNLPGWLVASCLA